MFTAYIYNKFSQYVTSYLNTDDDQSPYLLKYNHSKRVAENARQIAAGEGFTTKEIILAEIIGLLHDCGRFSQYFQYRTFNDKVSVDHAEQSALVILKNGFLQKCGKDDQDVILKAVQYHNKKILPAEKLTTKEKKFAKLIRDADKVDIFKVMVEQLKCPRINRKTLFLNQSEKIEFSENIRYAIRKHQLANLSDMKTVVDFRLIQLSWIFDINYNVTLNLIRKQGYFQYLAENIPGKDQIQKELTEINQKVLSNAVS